MDRLESFPVPVFALVSGPCIGGDLDLVVACHGVWASRSALFCHLGTSLGLLTGFGGTVRLPRKLPPAMARFLFLASAPLSWAGFKNYLIPIVRCSWK